MEKWGGEREGRMKGIRDQDYMYPHCECIYCISVTYTNKNGLGMDFLTHPRVPSAWDRVEGNTVSMDSFVI